MTMKELTKPRARKKKADLPVVQERDPEAGLDVVSNVDHVIARLDAIDEALVSYTNEALIDFFGAAKPLEKRLEAVNKHAREELIGRREEFGSDDKGHRYHRGEVHGVKLERRVTVKLEPDAEEKLEPYLHLFERELDVKLAEQALQAAGVERETYTRPVVTKDQLERLNEQGLIPDEVAVACLSPESVTWAAKPVAPAKVA